MSSALGAVLVPALLAGAGVGVLVGLPGGGRARLRGLSARAAPAITGESGGRGHQGRHPPLPAWVVRAGPAGVAGLFGLLFGGVVVGALVAVVTVVVVRGLRSRRETVRLARERARAVEACGALAVELRAGRAPAQALAAAAELADGPTGSALVSAASSAALGGDVAAALVGGHVDGSRAGGQPVAGRRSREVSAVPGLLRGLAACWTVCAATGSGLAAAVERLEEGQRAEQAQRRAVQAELAGPRATAGLLAALPVVGLLLAGALGANPLQVLLHTGVGQVCLVFGVGMDLLGLLWTGRIVARAEAGR